jgi:hypothetical protein
MSRWLRHARPPHVSWDFAMSLPKGWRPAASSAIPRPCPRPRAGVSPLQKCSLCHAGIAVTYPPMQRLRLHSFENKSVLWERIHILPEFVISIIPCTSIGGSTDPTATATHRIYTGSCCSRNWRWGSASLAARRPRRATLVIPVTGSSPILEITLEGRIETENVHGSR